MNHIFRKPAMYCLLTTTLAVTNLVYGQKDGTDIGRSREVSNVGTVAAPFLEIGAGARAAGMGGAFTGIADDPTALYWNTAGIGRQKGIGFSFNYSDWLVDLQYSYVAMVAGIGGWGGIGVSVTYLNYGDQPVRTINMPDGTGELYGANDFALGLAGAINLTDRFSIGIGTKYVQQRIWNEAASGFAMDLGILYETPLKGLELGGSISNFGTDLSMDGRDLLRPIDIDINHYSNDRINTKLKTDSYSLPLLFRFGLSYKVLDGREHELIAATDLLHPSSDTESMNVGMEYGFMRMVMLRVGYESLFQKDSITGATFGIGVRIRQLRSFYLTMDYVYKTFDLFGATNMISLGIRL